MVNMVEWLVYPYRIVVFLYTIRADLKNLLLLFCLLVFISAFFNYILWI